MFATVQIACSFVLLAGAGMLLATLVALQTARTGYEMRHVLVFDIPPPATGVFGSRATGLYQEAMRRIDPLPGVDGVAVGSFVPWRDAGSLVQASSPVEAERAEVKRIRWRGYGLPHRACSQCSACRSLPAATSPTRTATAATVAIVSQSVAQRMFSNGDALNRHMWWTDPYFGKPVPRRIVGVIPDVDDERVIGRPAMTIYMPVRQMGFAGRLFVRAAGDPYALVPAVGRHPVRPSNPSNAPRRSKTCARKCCRPTA